MKAVTAFGGVFALALWLASPSTAHAQTKSDAAAQAVFKDGLDKFDKGDFAAACPLLERAVELSSTPALGGMLTLAECFEKIDRPASAWGLYGKVAAAAKSEGQTDRAEKARKAADRLEPTLPKVHFAWKRSGPEPPNLRVHFGGVVIPADAWDVALPIDPGTTRFEFQANDRVSSTIKSDIPSGPGVTEVEAPELFAPPDGRAPVPGAEHRTIGPTHGDDPSHASAIGGVGVTGIVMGSIGLIGVGSSVGLMVDAKSKWNTAVTKDCGGNLSRCSTLGGIDSARSQGTAASAVFGVGLGLAAIGTGMLIVDVVTRSKKPSASTSEPALSFGAAPDGHGRGSAFASARWSLW